MITREEKTEKYLNDLREAFMSQATAITPMIEGMRNQLGQYEAQLNEINEKLEDLDQMLGVDEEEVETTEEEAETTEE